MTSIRRLFDADVRAIFESLHEGKPPPHDLPFKIVPVGPHGLRLSLPSYEFEDGLYVLLKPEKRRKQDHAGWIDAARAKTPSHLKRFLMNEPPSETCPWSLSGPQFPEPTAIQQRYCYPKGNESYASRKGGALWTMYGSDGKEDLQYRLLHVYFSMKRAVNKGAALSPKERASIQMSPMSRASSSSGSKTPQRRRRTAGERVKRSPWQQRRKPGSYPQQCVRRPNFVSRAAMSQPLPVSPDGGEAEGHAVFGAPHTLPSGRRFEDYPQFHPLKSIDEDDSPVNKKKRTQSLDHPFQDLFLARPDYALRHEDHHFVDDLHLFEQASLKNDPVLSAQAHRLPIEDETIAGAASILGEIHLKRPATGTPERDLASALGSTLQNLHEQIRDGVLAQPKSDQGVLVSMVADWAATVSRTPLKVQPFRKEADAAVVASPVASTATTRGKVPTTPV